MGIDVRTAIITDSEHVARFVTELGYPTSSAQMRTRLESILADDEYATLVAVDGRDVVGFIGTRIGPLYERDGQYGQIMAFAVAKEHQRRGIGRTLLQAAESILMARGVCAFVVTTSHHRADAHAFYEKNGYIFTGRRYSKSVPGTGSTVRS